MYFHVFLQCIEEGVIEDVVTSMLDVLYLRDLEPGTLLRLKKLCCLAQAALQVRLGLGFSDRTLGDYLDGLMRPIFVLFDVGTEG